MRLRYDPVEDRIALLIARQGDARAYWLTRRQCMALLRAFEEVPAVVTPPRDDPAGVISKAPPAGLPADLLPKLARIGLRRSAKALLVRLQAADEEIALQLALGPADQVQLRETLLQIARRAQWALAETRPGAAASEVARQLH